MKKIVFESFGNWINEHNVIKGEQPTGLTVEDVDSKEFLVGLAVESEHSKDLGVQKVLVLQNLNQNPKYYSEGMKKGIFRKPNAINIYKKYFIDKEKPKII